MKTYTISVKNQTIRGELQLPASKSISNRLLIIRALCGCNPEIMNLSRADDTVLLARILQEISAQSRPDAVREFDTANAGTVMRFLTAYLSMKHGKWVLTGIERMKQRPIGELVEALKSIGASIDYLAKPGYPPLLIRGSALTGREVTIDPGVSSQFTSALLLIAPSLPAGLRIIFRGQPVSSPYVSMTAGLLEHFGIRVKTGKRSIRVFPGKYKARPYRVANDWSAAAFWYEAASLAGEADLLLTGLDHNNLQGDEVLADIYRNFGVETRFTDKGVRLTSFRKRIDGFYFDFTDYPDIAQAVISTCVGLGIRGRFEGLQSLKIKETDRLRAIKNEIEKLGFSGEIVARGDVMTALEIRPVKPVQHEGLTFASYGDHRMAMSLAPLALKLGSLRIQNPDVVVKSYPDYWDHLRLTGFDVR